MTTARDRPIDRKRLIGGLAVARKLLIAFRANYPEGDFSPIYGLPVVRPRGGDWSRALFARPIYLLSEPYARSAAVLVDELDTGGF